MKRFMKICLVLTILMSVLGAGCLIASFSMGAEIPGLAARIQKFIDGETVQEEYKFSKHQVQALDLEAASGNLRIVQGDGDQIILKNEKLWMRTSLSEDGELKIQRRRIGFRFFGIGIGGKATLVLPKNMRFNEVSLDCGSGSISVEEILADELSIDCGSGDVDIDFADAKQLEIDSGSGDVNVKMTGKSADYDYEIDCGSGDVNFGEQHFRSTEHKLKEGRARSVEIDSGSGDVNIEFIGNYRKDEGTL